jgi:magnesium-transporting ATPase (P-type)
MIRVLRQIWIDPVWSKVIASGIVAAIAALFTYIGWTEAVTAFASARKLLTAVTPLSNALCWVIASLMAVFAGWMVWLIGRPLYRFWWARPSAFLRFRDAAARLYETTKAADLLSDSGLPASPKFAPENCARR